MKSSQIEKSILISELYDQVFSKAKTHGLNHELLCIFEGMLGANPSDQKLLATLTTLSKNMDEFNELSAWQNLDPSKLSLEDLKIKRKLSTEYKAKRESIVKSANDWQSKRYPESIKERNKRWVKQVDEIVSRENLSLRKAVAKVAKNDSQNGLKTPGDPWSAYIRALKSTNRTK